MAITIRANSFSEDPTAGVNFNTYIADYFAGLSGGSYAFYGGTQDGFYGKLNGDQMGFTYGDSDHQVVMGTPRATTGEGEYGDGYNEIAYDWIHYGSTYPHAISGTVDSLLFGYTTDDTGVGDNGLLQGLAAGLDITGLGIDTPPGTGGTGTTMLLYSALLSGDADYIYELLSGQAQNFIGTDGDDSYVGTAFDDVVRGNGGNDYIDGGAGADEMRGGLGNDTYGVDAAGDIVIEGKDGGIDTVESSVSFSLTANVEKLKLIGTDAIDGTGNNLDNTLLGNDAANVLEGGKGADRLNGGKGDDTLVGGAARDILVGAGGKDTFVFEAASESTLKAKDLIRDFSKGDLIDLTAIDANTGKSGNQDFTFIGKKGFSGTAGELGYKVVGDNIVVRADLDGDGHADFAIKLADKSHVSFSDFLV